VEQAGDQATDDDSENEVEDKADNTKFLPPVLKVKSGIRIFDGVEGLQGTIPVD
jgi:hypothetical protein